MGVGALRSLLPVALAAALLAGCAAPQPPPPLTVAERSAAQRVHLNPAREALRVDADTEISVPGFIPLSPLGLLVGVATQVAIAAAQQPGANRRALARDALENALGDTRVAAGDFAAAFDAELQRGIRAQPSVQVVGIEYTTDRRIRDAAAESRLFILRDIMLTSDARMLVARATTFYFPPGPAGRNAATRHFLVYSQPVDAPSDEAAVATWRAADARLLREQGRAIAAELATLVTTTVFAEQAPPMEGLPEVSIAVPSVAVIRDIGSLGTEVSFRTPEAARPRLLSRTADRAVVLLGSPPEAPRWVWISVPGGAVAGARGS